MPVHRLFYGVIALALAVYSLIGVNLGGFIVGMLLGAVGGVLSVAWMPKEAAADAQPQNTASADDETDSVDGTAEANRPLARGRR
jgi:uncharacterized YccA/Bax inhibitor family protein